MNKKNKIIFVSKLIFFTENNELIEDNLKIADLFESHEITLVIIAQQSTINILKHKIPQEYKMKIQLRNRGKSNINKIKELNSGENIFGFIGIVEADAIFSFQCKIPLFNPEKLSSGRVNISSKVEKYGLPILSFQDVINCLKAFEIHEENYFQIKFDDKFSVISLNNANTYHRPEEEVRVKEVFETNLKGNESTREQRILLLLLFHLINEVTTNDYFENVDYWGVFPSSNPANTDTSVAFLKEAIRVMVNGGPRTGPEILIRHSHMQPKHSGGSQLRLTNKCNEDFNTLKINPDLINKIKGKVICIVDDYITNGYSAESAKHLLLAAGAKEIIFISMGKFGRKYYSTNYSLKGEVSGEYTYSFSEEFLCRENYGGKNIYSADNDQEILRFGDLI